MGTARRVPLWTALGVVLVVALVVGSGVLRSAPPTLAQRALAIESSIRCPTCEDLSVAQSSAPAAVTARATVHRLLAEGATDAEVRQYLVDRYGQAIELDPPAAGWSLLVWVVPLAGGAVGLAVLVVVLARRRVRPVGEGAGGVDTGPALDPAEVAERRLLLERSLADADAEYLAGDLSDRDYLALRQRDLARLAALGGPSGRGGAGGPAAAATVVAERTEPPADGPAPGAASPDAAPDPTVRPRRSRRSWLLLGGAVVAFGAALAVAAGTFASPRLPGDTATGGAVLSPAQQLAKTLDQAAVLVDEGQAAQAARLYQSVLAAHPDDEVALAQLGWLEYQTGVTGSDATLVAEGRSMLDRAQALAPGDYAVHLYLGTVDLQQDRDPAAAVAQYRRFLADHPPAVLVHQAASEVASAFRGAGLPVPAAVTG